MPEMFGVNQRLELSATLFIPRPKRIWRQARLGENCCQEFGLLHERRRLQTGALPGLLQRGKIHMRGQILFPWLAQNVAAHVMARKGSQSPLGALRMESLFIQQPIVNGY